LRPFPQPEEITAEVEEEAEGSTLATNKAHQANNNNNNNIQANKPKGGLNEEAEEEDSQQEEVREEPMGLKPLTCRTPDPNVCSAA
jgi:hypothetical protein